MDKLEKKIPVIGTSCVNHNVRKKLGISVSEYIMLQFFDTLFEDGYFENEHICQSQLGESLEKVTQIKQILIERKLLVCQPFKNCIPNQSWYKEHKQKGFEFAMFYQPIIVNSEQIEWRNSSKDSTKRKIVQVLKFAPIEQLIYSKLRYFISKLETKSLDYVMSSERFIGQDKYYETRYGLKPEGEDWLMQYIKQNHNENSQLNLMDFVTSKIEQSKSCASNSEDFFND